MAANPNASFHPAAANVDAKRPRPPNVGSPVGAKRRPPIERTGLDPNPQRRRMDGRLVDGAGHASMECSTPKPIFGKLRRTGQPPSGVLELPKHAFFRRVECTKPCIRSRHFGPSRVSPQGTPSGRPRSGKRARLDRPQRRDDGLTACSLPGILRNPNLPRPGSAPGTAMEGPHSARNLCRARIGADRMGLETSNRQRPT